MTVNVVFTGNGRVNAIDPGGTPGSNTTLVTVVKISGAGNAPSSVTADGFIQGTSAVAQQVSRQHDFIYYDSGTTYDFTAGGAQEGQHVYIWANFLASSLLTSSTSGTGFGVFLHSATPAVGDYALWQFYGADTYAGGWVRFTLDPNKTPTSNVGTTFDPSAVRYFGVYADVGNNTARFDNLLMDAIDIGVGYTVTGSSTLGLFQELLAYDDNVSNKYGIVTSLNSNNSAINLNGQLILGDTGASVSAIEDTASKIFCQQNEYYNGSAYVSSTLATVNDISVVGGSGNNSLTFGAASGTTSGINGITLVGVADNPLSIDFSDGNVETGEFYGCSFEKCDGTLSFDSSTHVFRGNTVTQCVNATTGDSISFVTGSSVLGSSFIESGTVLANGTTTVDRCTFAEADLGAAAAALEIASLSQVTNTGFARGTAGHAIDLGTLSIGADTPVALNGVTFSGYGTGSTGTFTNTGTVANAAIKVVNNSGFTLTINVATDSDIPTIENTGTSPVVVQQSVNYIISNIIDGSEIDLIRISDGVQLATVETIGASPAGVVNFTIAADPNNAGRYQATYQYSGSDAPISAKVVVMNFDYQHYAQNVTLTTSDGGLLVSQIIDRNYLDPD